MQHFQVFKVPFSFAKMGPQKAVVQKVSPFGPHPQELHASFQESPSVLNNFKSIMDSLLMCKCVKSFLPYLLFPSLSMQTFFSSIVLAPELAPGKLTTPAPLLLLLFLVPDDSDTGDTISSGVLVLSSKSMLQNLLVQPGTSLSVHRHLLHFSIQVSPACLGAPLSLLPHRFVDVWGSAAPRLTNKLDRRRRYIVI